MQINKHHIISVDSLPSIQEKQRTLIILTIPKEYKITMDEKALQEFAQEMNNDNRVWIDLGKIIKRYAYRCEVVAKANEATRKLLQEQGIAYTG